MTRPSGAAFELVASDRLLVVAPHPDDDALACGGTLALATRARAAVRVVYATDGSASHPASLAFAPGDVRAIREREALAGLAALGVAPEHATFLRARDGALSGRDARIARDLAAIVELFAPTIVLAPFESDPHPDHRATARLVERALAVAAPAARHLRYAVWLEQRGSLADRRAAAGDALAIVDTRAVLAQKRRAIAAHRSQFGRVVRDDPNGFRLPHELIARACTGEECFYVRGTAAIGRPA